MQYIDLLGTAWPKVGREDREKALGLAYTAGREAAKQALTEKGGSGLLAYRKDSDLVEFFFHYLIQDPEFFDEMDDSDRGYWMNTVKDSPTVDPRLPAFCRGWRRFMDQEILETSPIMRAVSDAYHAETHTNGKRKKHINREQKPDSEHPAKSRF